jgi:dipeptidyl aminopeptidase/acylaminoacyl peptidase
MGVHSELFRVPLSTGKPEQLTKGDHALGDWTWSASANAHVFTLHEMASPGEVWLLRGDAKAPQQVTSVFDYLPRQFRLPRQVRVDWKGADGVTVEGLLVYPLEYEAGHRYPLVVQTHGGPQASDKFGLGGSQNYNPVLAARGYAVLQPNYRGSTGYGDAFTRDMVGHYFKNAHLDVLAGVDYLIKIGVADSAHLIKMGWSGGGHMTNKIITYTTRFKAASSGAGAADWISMYAQSDVRSYRTPWFGGTPWQKDAPITVYWDNSPLKDVWKVKTPTIFLVGQNDQRVPEPQSVEMYRALRSNGVPSHLYVAPREPHGWEELRHVLFKMNVEVDWFETQAMHRAYVWDKAPGDTTDVAGAAKKSAAGDAVAALPSE